MNPWIIAIRPKTLPISICPVILGSCLAPTFHFWIFFYTLLTTIGIQVTSHFANDYFDFIKGSESPERKGPVKVLQAGLVKVDAMRRATITCALATALLGGYLVFYGGMPIALLLVLSIALAILYTGGPYPLCYLGISDLFAFVFYGPIAVAGTYYLHAHAFSGAALIAGIAPGAYSASILMLVNLRDIEEDRVAGKKTIPVRFGALFGKALYLAALTAALTTSLLLGKFLPLILIIPAAILMRNVIINKDPYAYNPFFKTTTLLLAAHTLLFCLYP